MATSIEEIIARNQREASELRNMQLYDRAPATDQANRVTKDAAFTDQQLSRERNNLLTDINKLQEERILFNAEQQASMLDHRSTVMSKLEAGNKPLTEMREQYRTELTEDARRLNEIDAERDKSGFFGKIINGIRYNMMEAETAADARRHNLVTGLINQNYKAAGRALNEYRSTEYMQNAMTFQANQALEANRLQLMEGKIKEATGLTERTEKRAQNIWARTLPDPDKSLKDAMSSTPFMFMHSMTGNADRPMTKNDARAYKFALENSTPQFRNAITRGMFAWQRAYEQGDLWGPAEINTHIAKNGTLSELGALAQMNPDLQTRQLTGLAMRSFEANVAADVEENYAKRKGIKKNDEGAYDFNPAQLEELSAMKQNEMSRRMQTTSARSAMQGYADSKSAQVMPQVIDPSGAEINPESFTSNGEFLQSVVSQYMDPNQFVKLMGDDQFRSSFVGSSDSVSGLADKQLTMYQHLKDNSDLSESQAAELAAKSFKTYYTGKALRQAPELGALYSFDVEPKFKLEVSYPDRTAVWGGDDRSFDLAQPLNLLEIEARQKSNAQAVERRAERAQASSEAFDVFGRGLTGGLGPGM